LADPSRSVFREIGPKKIREFSSFNDYLKVLIDDRTVTSSHDLVTRLPKLLGEILFKWYQQGQIACVFAQNLADAATPKWGSITIKDAVDSEKLELVLQDAAENLHALQLIFPEKEGEKATALHACELIKSLCEHPSWSCKEVPWMEDEKGRSLLVGLRWHRKGSDYTSWVLGIAPFDTMPFTRRFVGAPFIALVLRSAPPAKFRPAKKKESGLKPSHLAHMDDLLGEDQEKRDRFDERTHEAKIALLGGDLLSTARAKVTFALPLWCRDVLGKTLTQIEPE
jgi:hypothetical protein